MAWNRSTDSELPVRRAAEDCGQRIQERIRRLEQALALQKDFPALPLTAWRTSPKQDLAPVWVPYGQERWLISLAPPLPERDRLVVVVRGRKMLDSVTANVFLSERIAQSIQFTSGENPDGESLGPSFPGLSLAFVAEDGVSRSADWGPWRSFYLIALILVLSMTLFGAYLLWVDVRRELRMAEIRSQFVASVSHELKTPLTAIQMFAETLLLGRAKDSQTKTEYLHTIVNECNRLTRLLNNVLDFSKIEKGKRTYRKEAACLREIVQAAAQATRYPLTQQGFQLEVHVEDDLPDLCVDRDAIEQAILNLLSNAMKYSGDSRGIALRLEKRDGDIVIEVSDHGVGIEPTEQKRVFEKFHRLPGERNDQIPGAGLGLALVSHIVDAHDGRVDVKSAVGEGSTFSIYLPLEGKR